MDYSRDQEHMESNLLDTILSSVGCVGEDRENVLVAQEGEWRNLLAKFRSDHHMHHSRHDASYDDQHRRMVMLHNSSVVGEKIVKVAQSFVKTKLTDEVKNATDVLPPEVLEDKGRLYQALLSFEEVAIWTKAQKHMEVGCFVRISFLHEIRLPYLYFLLSDYHLGALEICSHSVRPAKCIRLRDSSAPNLHYYVSLRKVHRISR